VLDVPLPRPRRAADTGLVALKSRLLALIQQEMPEAFSHAGEDTSHPSPAGGAAESASAVEQGALPEC
ncbi:MAG: hypothetical protein HY660_00695, partial [Armatimonadetes bacterium]|nr:hypothetical protein [Armatimonadota bacterium]